MIALAIVSSANTYSDYYDYPQQNKQIVIGDTALIDNEEQPQDNKKATVTFTKRTNKSQEEKAVLQKKEKKQTIRGLFSLGGFDKDKKTKTNYE